MARPAVRSPILAAVALLTAAPIAFGQDAQRPARVLLLFQQQADAQPMPPFTNRLRAQVEKELASPVEFYQESLDIDRFVGREQSPSLVDYFADKYRAFQIDVVVPVGDRALIFALDRLGGVLPGVPIVLALGTSPKTDPSRLPAHVTGRIAPQSRYTPTLSMARQLQPDAERVVVVGGAGPFDSVSVTGALAAVDSLRDSLQLTLLQGLPFDSLLRALRQLPPRSIVLFANYKEDPQGRVFETIDIVGSLAHASSAPMYVQQRAFVGEGVVGGAAMSLEDEGDQTGRQIVRVLRRKPDVPMPPVELIAKPYVADWRQLQRWGLSEKRLPPGTVVVFREPTLWQRYRTVVLLALAVISVQLLLIGALLVERRRRQRAQLVLEEEQRRADEARLQVVHMGRVALVGELAATISHELRQPLAAIRTNAEAGAALLSGTPGDISEAREILHSIVSDNARAVDVIESVRKLLRKDESVVVGLDLNQVCREAVRILQPDAARRHVRLEMTPATVAPIITGDPVQLQQAVLNLLLNALDAAELSSADRFVVVQVESRVDHVEVTVRDSGTGLPPNVKAHLFKSFHSTKKGGLGLGLVIVRSIVERHGGHVRPENHGDGGAVFRIWLPGSPRSASAQATQDDAAGIPAAPAEGQTEAIEAVRLEG